MCNVSKKKREEMLKFLDKLREKHSDDASIIAINAIENALVEKKYGLVWEEHEERVDKELKTKIPVFTEVSNKEIVMNDGERFNFLIEGDNLHSLYLLEKTHKGNVDVIYIDPPYNTGNKDFMYNDEYIDKDDSWRHSKWISFMSKRLRLAKNLLKEDGVIFIHIDENEFAQLKLLCDEIFYDTNFIGAFVWKSRGGKGGTNAKIATEHEYIFCYAKNYESANLKTIKKVGSERKEQLRQWGQGVYREDRQTMFFPLLYKKENNEKSTITEEEYRRLYNNETDDFDDDFLEKLRVKYENEGWVFILPIINGRYGRWRAGRDTIVKLLKETDKNKERIEFEEVEDGYKPYRIYPKGNETESVFGSLILDKGTASDGTRELKMIFKDKVFDTTKPLDVTTFLLDLVMFDKEEGIVLDFFAGSGTTGLAVMRLNEKDGGNRKFILCTNNESNICEEVTYPRVKSVIEGYHFKGKKETVLYKKKFNQSDLRKMDERWKEIDKIKEENKSKYDSITTSFTNGVYSIYGVKEYDDKTESYNANLKYYKTDYINRYCDDDFYISDELMSHIKEMVQLENHVNIDNEGYVIFSNDKDLLEFMRNECRLDNCKKIYKPSYVFFDTKQLKEINDRGIEVITIPEYYFASELREVGEL